MPNESNTPVYESNHQQWEDAEINTLVDSSTDEPTVLAESLWSPDLPKHLREHMTKEVAELSLKHQRMLRKMDKERNWEEERKAILEGLKKLHHPF